MRRIANSSTEAGYSMFVYRYHTYHIQHTTTCSYSSGYIYSSSIITQPTMIN